MTQKSQHEPSTDKNKDFASFEPFPELAKYSDTGQQQGLSDLPKENAALAGLKGAIVGGLAGLLIGSYPSYWITKTIHGPLKDDAPIPDAFIEWVAILECLFLIGGAVARTIVKMKNR